MIHSNNFFFVVFGFYRDCFTSVVRHLATTIVMTAFPWQFFFSKIFIFMHSSVSNCCLYFSFHRNILSCQLFSTFQKWAEKKKLGFYFSICDPAIGYTCLYIIYLKVFFFLVVVSSATSWKSHGNLCSISLF